jgi:Mlc titration factor MtfA (ptsG expression regulator)
VPHDSLAELVAVAPQEYHRLSADEQDRFHVHADRLVRRVSWEAARDFSITSDMIHTVAAHAALIVAGFDPVVDPFRNVAAVVLHGGTIVTTGPQPGPVSGVMTAAPRYLAGQSGHGRGPVLLDWRTVRQEVSRPNRGTNVVYHEFAHKLDQLDGDADGMPPIADAEARQAWEQTMGTNFRRLQRRGATGLVRAYGATNPAEYFAVTSEVFFTRSVDLRAQMPRLYERLAEFYRQDPAARAAPPDE